MIYIYPWYFSLLALKYKNYGNERLNRFIVLSQREILHLAVSKNIGIYIFFVYTYTCAENKLKRAANCVSIVTLDGYIWECLIPYTNKREYNNSSSIILSFDL